MSFAALPAELTFTVDVEAHGRDGAARCAPMTHRILDLLDATNAVGTFFVVGEIAERERDLVREIARRGHEVGCHGWRHQALCAVPPERLRAELLHAKALLEDLAGAPVLGFRAPMFSLTPRTAWVPDLLAGMGLAYSSSVLPAWNPLHGWPGAPRRPFLWRGGLLEIPCPVGHAGPFALPFLGGMYLRYLPGYRLRWMSRQVAAQGARGVWTYCHPYDLDAEEPFARRADAGFVASLLLWLRRGHMETRLTSLLQGRGSVPFAARLEKLQADAPVFGPGEPGLEPRLGIAPVTEAPG